MEEPGSGPGTGEAQADWSGWNDLTGSQRVFQASTTHPKYPSNLLPKYEQQIEERLRANDTIRAAVERVQFVWSLRQGPFEAWLRSVLNALDLEATSAGPRDIPVEARRAFIAKQACPELSPLYSATPATIIANAGDTSFPVDVEPGAIIIKVAGLGSGELKNLVPLVTIAQNNLQYDRLRSRGGRTPNKDKPETRELAVQAAELFNPSESAHGSKSRQLTRIASMLNIPRDGEEPTDEVVHKRVERLVRVGQEIRQELSDG